MTDNLSKADEEILEMVELSLKEAFAYAFNKGFQNDHNPDNDRANAIRDKLIAAIKQRDAVRDKALNAKKEAYMNKDISEIVFRVVQAIERYEWETADKLISVLKELVRLEVTIINSKKDDLIPGFENTMSDLDKLTVKPANEEERA